MSEKPYSYPPFRSELVPSDIDAIADDASLRERIKALEDDPETIVRMSQPNLEALDAGVAETVGRAKREYDLLRDRYGIPVSAQFVIVGEDENRATIYGVTDRVHPVEASDESARSEQAARVRSLLTYYYHKLATFNEANGSTDPYLNDIALVKQYVHGTTADDPEPRMRLVDIDYEHVGTGLHDIVRVLEELTADESGMLSSYVRWAQRAGVSLQSIRGPLLGLMGELDELATHTPPPLDPRRLALLRERLETLFAG